MSADIVKLELSKPPSRLKCIRSAVNAAANTLSESRKHPGFLAGSNMERALLALSSAIALIDNEIDEREQKQ